MKLNELRPPAGSKPRIIVYIDGVLNGVPVNEFDFSKDYDAACGTGSMEFQYRPTYFNKIKSDASILVREGWITPDGKEELKEVMSGIIDGEPKIDNDKMSVDISDEGYLLEAEASVSYTQKKRSFIMKDIIKKAGLNPVVDFKGVKDDVLDYSTESESGTSGGGAGVTGAGLKSCGRCSLKEGKPNYYKSTVENKCPECGKSGTIVWVQGKDYHYCAKEDNAGVEGMYVCCQKLGGCDSDWCISGHNHTASHKDLTVISQPTPTSGPITLSLGTGTSADTQVEESSESQSTGTSTETDAESTPSTKTFWDMLLELCDPVGHDLEVFVWLHNCYVRKVPNRESASLHIDGAVNLGKDISIDPGDPNVPNTVIVHYGNKTFPSTVTVGQERLVEKYGTAYNKKEQVFNKYNMNEAEARAFATRELDKANRDSEFNIDCSVIGHPEWYICRWATFKAGYYDLEDVYYITRFNKKFSATDGYNCDLSLTEYRPTIEVASEEEEGIGKTQNLGALLAPAKHFSYCGCSDASCFVKGTCGDCWAMSDWIYNRLTGAGIRCRVVQYATSQSPRHRSVQLWNGKAWVDLDYGAYGIKNIFTATTNKPGLFVFRGG